MKRDTTVMTTNANPHEIKPDGCKRPSKWHEVGEDYIMRSFTTWTLHQVFHDNQSRKMRLTWHVAHMEETRNAYKILVGKTWKEETSWKSLGVDGG